MRHLLLFLDGGCRFLLAVTSWALLGGPGRGSGTRHLKAWFWCMWVCFLTWILWPTFFMIGHGWSFMLQIAVHFFQTARSPTDLFLKDPPLNVMDQTILVVVTELHMAQAICIHLHLIQGIFTFKVMDCLGWLFRTSSNHCHRNHLSFLHHQLEIHLWCRPCPESTRKTASRGMWRNNMYTNYTIYIYFYICISQGIVGCTPTNVPLWEIPI